VPRVGYPDPATFAEGFAAAAGFVDSLPHERVALGGFSQGAVMSLSVGLGRGRPRPAAIVALSGFVPVVDGWELGTEETFPPIALAHGTFDPIIPVELAHRSRASWRPPARGALPRVADAARNRPGLRRGPPALAPRRARGGVRRGGRRAPDLLASPS
jgi:acetyl esterase/lipase